MKPLTDAVSPAWMTAATCAQIGGDMWFPEKGVNGTTIAMVKAMCAECPVRLQCLEWAIETESWDGVFGGLSSKQRRKVVRDRKEAA